MTEMKAFSETHARVILEQGHGNHFMVRVGRRWILTFGVSPREVKTWDDTNPLRTTRKDHAVSGWRTGVLSGIRAYCGSLLDLAGDLSGYGLDVEPVLERAEELGWPSDIVDEARARAEESYRYQAEQVADLPAVSLLSVSFVDETRVEVGADGIVHVWPAPWIEDAQPYVTVSRACLAGPGCITDERRMLDAVHTGLIDVIDDLTVGDCLPGSTVGGVVAASTLYNPGADLVEILRLSGTGEPYGDGGYEPGTTERAIQKLKDMLRAVEEQVLL